MYNGGYACNFKAFSFPLTLMQRIEKMRILCMSNKMGKHISIQSTCTVRTCRGTTESIAEVYIFLEK